MKISHLATVCLLASQPLFSQVLNRPGQRVSDPIPADVENVYTNGLNFLSRSQSASGSWEGQSGYSDFPGTVALCLLALLAHGDDPNHGPYAKQISSSIDFLLNSQQVNGYIGSAGKNSGRGSMYNHGFATLALAEAYGMVEDERLGEALQKAVNLILTAQKQNRLGAWRYSPEANDADSTVAGCQIVALFAARNAGIAVPDEALTKALKYMDSCRSKTNGSYGYMNASGGKVTLTAIGLLCQALAKEHDTDEFRLSLEYLKKNLSYRDANYPYYFEYYMSQALFHADEKVWNQWNKMNVKFLKTLQQSDGSINGNKGKPFSTAASLLSLALNYRFLPIYEK